MYGYPASKIRRLLAFILGVSFLAVFYFNIEHFFIAKPLPGIYSIGIILLCYILFDRLFRFNFGFRALGMSRSDGSTGTKGEVTVAPNVYDRESWLTILVGLLAFFGGVRSLVEWSVYILPFPVFGTIPSKETAAILTWVIGLGLIAIGYLLLTMRKSGWLAYFVYVIVEGCSTYLSKDLIAEYLGALASLHAMEEGQAVNISNFAAVSNISFSIALGVSIFEAILLLVVSRRYFRA